jgi:four helix bundle protein
MAVARATVMHHHPDDLSNRIRQLHERTFIFAKRVLDLCPRHYVDDPSRVIWRQLIRSAPSSSGMLEEADEASSRNDFVYKMRVALREMRESKRWLLFISHCQLQQHQHLGDLQDEARQLASIFAAIIRNTERRETDDPAARNRKPTPRDKQSDLS